MRILTGVKPTGEQLHIANYFGAVKPMIDLSNENPSSDIFLFLANMHGLSTLHDPVQLMQNSFNILKIYISCGIDLDKFVIYNPAKISAHAELNRVISCLTHMGIMERMHAYKDAIAKGKANETSVGTFCYPILMACDILLYDTDFVPVGQDQKQHVEFARDIAERFNLKFGQTFKLPQAYIKPEVATIQGIDGRKMSKSYNNYIGILEDEDTLLKKIKQISTDTKTVEESKDPDSCNVYNILRLLLTEKENQELRKKYTDGGLSYKTVKDMLYERILDFVTPIKKRYNNVEDDFVRQILEKNQSRVKAIADAKIQDVYKKVGFSL